MMIDLYVWFDHSSTTETSLETVERIALLLVWVPVVSLIATLVHMLLDVIEEVGDETSLLTLVPSLLLVPITLTLTLTLTLTPATLLSLIPSNRLWPLTPYALLCLVPSGRLLSLTPYLSLVPSLLPLVWLPPIIILILSPVLVSSHLIIHSHLIIRSSNGYIIRYEPPLFFNTISMAPNNATISKLLHHHFTVITPYIEQSSISRYNLKGFTALAGLRKYKLLSVISGSTSEIQPADLLLECPPVITLRLDNKLFPILTFWRNFQLSSLLSHFTNESSLSVFDRNNRP